MNGFWSALVLVFVAELGDKTQLVALGFGARHRLAPVLAGIMAAYIATSALSVVLGAAAGEAFPDDALKVVGGVLFLAFAAWTWLGDDGAAHDAPGDSTSAPTTSGSSLRIVASVASAIFVAELGDKTMLATATLASTGNAIAVFVGALLGIFAAGAVGAIVGRQLGDRLPARTVRLGSALLFAVFGAALIVSAF